MELVNLIDKFKNWNLLDLEGDPLISTKTKQGKIFPPYIPFVGTHYKDFKILIYATAQNFNINNQKMYDPYEKNFDKLVERLWYQIDFKTKYPDMAFRYTDISIAPYEEGVLPALAGIFIYTFWGQILLEFDEIQDHLSVSNYYKFSLNDGKDINPQKASASYWKLNDALVSEELEVLRPKHIIVFKGRHKKFLEDKQNEFSFKVHFINDPSWILHGHQGYCKPEGKWGKSISNADHDIFQYIDSYLEVIKQSQSYGSKIEAIKIYLLHYYLEWKKFLASGQ